MVGRLFKGCGDLQKRGFAEWQPDQIHADRKLGWRGANPDRSNAVLVILERRRWRADERAFHFEIFRTASGALVPPSAAGSEWPISWVVERPSKAVIRDEM